MANWTSLREANTARNIEWTGGQSIQDYTWRGCELTGEVGEIVEVLHSPDLWELRETELGPELADGAICVELAALTLGLPEIPLLAQGSVSVGGIQSTGNKLLRDTAALANVLKKLERERRGWPGSRETPEKAHLMLRNIMGKIGLIAAYCSVDLKAHVSRKFNETSEKVGLVTRLYY